MRFSEQEEPNAKRLEDIVPLTGAHGFDAENQTIREQPIGRLDRQYTSSQLRNGMAVGSPLHVRGGLPAAPPIYTRIPPLAILDQFWEQGHPLPGVIAMRSSLRYLREKGVRSGYWLQKRATAIGLAALALTQALRRPAPTRYSVKRGAYADWETVSVHMTSRLAPIVILAALIITITVFHPFQSGTTSRPKSKSTSTPSSHSSSNATIKSQQPANQATGATTKQEELAAGSSGSAKESTAAANQTSPSSQFPVDSWITKIPLSPSAYYSSSSSSPATASYSPTPAASSSSANSTSNSTSSSFSKSNGVVSIPFTQTVAAPSTSVQTGNKKPLSTSGTSITIN